MNAHEAVKSVLRVTGTSGRSASKAIGRGPTYISATLNKPRAMQSNTLAAIAAVCGYELVLRPRGGADGEAFVIDE